MIEHRLAKLKNILKTKGVDALWITDPVNVYYMSGFKTDVSSILITKDNNFIITDFRYKQNAQEISSFKVMLIKTGLKNTLKKILKDSGVKRLGFEANHLSCLGANMVNAFLKKERITFKPLSGAIEELRVFKDKVETKEIKKAIIIAKAAIAGLKKEIKPGVSEKRLSILLDNLIRGLGADGNAFETIIAFGQNSSRPHAYTTHKTLKQNEHILIDFGVKINSYNCDLTRVFFLGRIQKILKDIYCICKEAQGRAIRMVKPGVRMKDIDRAARSYINSKGLGECFGHSLGHGVGLSIHELPRISSKNSKIIKPGMVFTIEPGIYVDGIGGIRLEDMVLVTEKGCEVLTDDISK